MQRRVLGLGGLLVTGLVAAALLWWPHGTDAGSKAVTEAEARRFLAKIVAAAQAHDFDAMCALNGAVSNCRDQLGMVGKDSVPSEAPRVVGFRFDPKDSPDDTPTWVLVIEGVDGHGKPYHSEVGVFWEDSKHLKAINAVFWANFKVLSGDGVVSPG